MRRCPGPHCQRPAPACCTLQLQTVAQPMQDTMVPQVSGEWHFTRVACRPASRRASVFAARRTRPAGRMFTVTLRDDPTEPLTPEQSRRHVAAQKEPATRAPARPAHGTSIPRRTYRYWDRGEGVRNDRLWHAGTERMRSLKGHTRHPRVSHLVHSFVPRVLRSSVDNSVRALTRNRSQDRLKIPACAASSKSMEAALRSGKTCSTPSYPQGEHRMIDLAHKSGPYEIALPYGLTVTVW